MAEPDHLPVDRRTLLRGAGGGVLAAGLLVACGDDDAGGEAVSSDSSSPDATDGGTGGGGGAGGSADALAATSDVEVGGGVIIAEKYVITQPTKGEFKGFSAICTHAQCVVGSVEGGQIVCPCHNSTYSIEDGSVTGGPAPAPLPEESIKVQGDDIVLA